MGCGTKIDSFDNYHLSDRLEREGEYSLASKVRRGECLDSYDLRHAEDALERQGLRREWDYRERHCLCTTEEEEREY